MFTCMVKNTIDYKRVNEWHTNLCRIDKYGRFRFRGYRSLHGKVGRSTNSYSPTVSKVWQSLQICVKRRGGGMLRMGERGACKGMGVVERNGVGWGVVEMWSIGRGMDKGLKLIPGIVKLTIVKLENIEGLKWVWFLEIVISRFIKFLLWTEMLCEIILKTVVMFVSFWDRESNL